jgi:hypothetical protein
MRIRGSPDVLVKAAPKLLREGEQNLVLVVDGLLQERDELLPRAIGSEGEGNGGDTMDRVQTELNVLRPQLVHENGYRGNLKPIHSQRDTRRTLLDDCTHIITGVRLLHVLRWRFQSRGGMITATQRTRMLRLGKYKQRCRIAESGRCERSEGKHEQRSTDPVGSHTPHTPLTRCGRYSAAERTFTHRMLYYII